MIQYESDSFDLTREGYIVFEFSTPKDTWSSGHNALLEIGGLLKVFLDSNGVEGVPIDTDTIYRCMITWNDKRYKVMIEDTPAGDATVPAGAGDKIVRFGQFKDNPGSRNTLVLHSLFWGSRYLDEGEWERYLNDNLPVLQVATDETAVDWLNDDVIMTPRKVLVAINEVIGSLWDRVLALEEEVF